MDNLNDLDRFVSLIDVNDVEALRNELELHPENVHLATENDWNLLMMSVSHGVNECVQVLVEAGIDTDRTNIHGKTALMLAASHDNCEGAKLLLQKGASLILRNKEGLSAFEIAMQPGVSKNCEALLRIFAPYSDQFDAKDLALYKENRLNILYL